jgi:hypothetical protein
MNQDWAFNQNGVLHAKVDQGAVIKACKVYVLGFQNDLINPNQSQWRQLE